MTISRSIFTALLNAFLVLCLLSCTRDQGLRQSGSSIENRNTTSVDEDVEGDNDEEEENEVEIDPDNLPQSVVSALAFEYPGAEILEADQITSNGIITYDVEIQYQGKVIEPMFDSSGNFLGLDEED